MFMEEEVRNIVNQFQARVPVSPQDKLTYHQDSQNKVLKFFKIKSVACFLCLEVFGIVLEDINIFENPSLKSLAIILPKKNNNMN